MGHPHIYPTGTTLYVPEKCFNGYTLFQAKELGALLIDMNGREVKLWKDLQGFPNKLLPGGQVFGHSGERAKAFGSQDDFDLLQVDWEGNVVWKFDQLEYIQDGDEDARWMARQHHDYQREGNPVGYYVPGMEPLTSGKTLLLCHKDKLVPAISDQKLLDDVIIEVDHDGKILWQWEAADHFEEIGFSAEEKEAIYHCPSPVKGLKVGDWLHINCASYLGPNKWYEQGDERFHPDNIIIDSRHANFMAIISKATGELVWQIGPDFTTTPELLKLGQLIGMHHAHMIPQDLPGEGNILVFDNGGWAGYGHPDVNSSDGTRKIKRDYSRVLEFDPLTLKIQWQFSPYEYGKLQPFLNDHFYSPYISSAQRLPNGNTLICEGNDGHLLEVTREHEVVWEYISPYWGTKFVTNMVYRAYRYPYEYVPQEPKPTEIALLPIEVKNFRLPGAAPMGEVEPTVIEGLKGYEEVAGFCINTDDAPEIAE